MTPLCSGNHYQRRSQMLLLSLIVPLVIALAVSSSARASDLKQCMSEMIHNVDDSMTIAQVRSACRKKLAQTKTAPEEEPPPTVAEKRMRQDENQILEPFTLMSHKPNYFMFAYNSYGYDAELYQGQFEDPSIEFNDGEAQFQLSVKTPLAVNLFDTVDIYAAYTNRSFWQLFNENSAPFRETNHEPEAWLQFNADWQILGFRNFANQFGIVHQSNGRGGELSRSWDRIYADFLLERGNFVLSFKPWYRLPESEEDDENPDITDYLGHYELRGFYKWNDHTFSLMSRNNLESGFSKGALELSWSFPLGKYPFLKGYVQYFTGYGESLIDYDNYVNRIGIGLAVTDWL